MQPPEKTVSSESLRKRIAKLRTDKEPDAGDEDRRIVQTSRAMRLVTEMIAGVVVGGFLGYVLDRALGTLPVFSLILLLLGIIAGFLNMYRAANRWEGEQ